jgi:hypothetical protein
MSLCEYGWNDCDADAAYHMILLGEDDVCDKRGPDGKCTGHGFCADHVAHVRKNVPQVVASVRSLHRDEVWS